MGDYNFDFMPLIRGLIILGVIFGVLTFFVGIWVFKKDYVESKTLIVPEKKLQTDGKTVDTIYIYRTKNN